MNEQSPARKSVSVQRLNLECPIHKCLNKYYLKKENRFVCEYDGFDRDGPDGYWHLPQVLEHNRSKILKLQSNQPSNLASTSPELQRLLPLASNEYKNLANDNSKLAAIIDELGAKILSKITNGSFSTEGFNELKDVLNQINFNADGKPDLKKIGIDASKERNLIALAQMLVLMKDQEPEKEKIYDNLMNFLAIFQDRFLELINQSNRTIDMMNGDFAHEIARLEGRVHDPLKRYNKFRSYYMTRPEHEKILREKELEWSKKNNIVDDLNNNLNNLRGENFKLSELLKKLNFERDAERRNMQAEIDALKRQMGEASLKANEYYKKRISELEYLLNDRERELSEIKRKNDNEILDLKKKYEGSMIALRNENKKQIDDLEGRIGSEIANSKKMALDRDNIQARLNEALSKLSKLEDELKFKDLSNDKRAQYLESQVKELNVIKEKLEAELQNERNRYVDLNGENMDLRKKLNESSLKLVDLDEYIKNQGLDQQKASSSLQLQLNEMKRLKDQWEKKFNALDYSMQEERAKYNSTISLLEKRAADYNEQLEELRRVNNAYLDRISELEREVYDQRNHISRLDLEKGALNQTIIDLQNQLNMQAANSKNLKSEELRKITELSSQVNNFPKIKDMLNNRIKELEEALVKEKSDFIQYRKDSEIKIHTLQVSLSDLNSENITLKHQIDMLRNELDNEKARQVKKINDLTLLLQEVTKLKDKNQADFTEEKGRLIGQIHELEKKLKELQYQFDDHSGKNEYNYKRVKELELILSDERNKYEKYVLDNEKKIADLTQRLIELQRANDSLQRRIIELEHDLADEKAKNLQLILERDNFYKGGKEKEANLYKIIEELRKGKLEDDKTISELSTKTKDLNRIREKLDSRIQELEDQLKHEKEKNLNGCAIHERLNQELQAKYDDAFKTRELLDKENSDLKARIKALLGEKERLIGNVDLLNRSNKALEDELAQEKAKYNNSLPAMSAEIERLRRENKNLEDEVENLTEKLKKLQHENDSLNKTLPVLTAEREKLRKDHCNLEDENEDLRNKLKKLQAENDLLKEKINELHDELNQLRDSNKNIPVLLKNNQNLNHENDEHKNRIKNLEDELADKYKKIDELQKANQNLEKKNKEQEALIAKLKEQIKNLEEQLANARKPEPVPPMVMSKPILDYRNIDFYNDDYDDLLLNKKNWPIVDPWFNGLRNNTNGPLKTNLLYKATRDGFSHNNFKEKCLNIPNTMVVILTEYNKLVGGFVPMAWKRPVESHQYVRDESRKTFVFSVTNGKKCKLIKPNYAVCNAQELGPIFGGGSDIEIVSDSNRVKNNFSNIGHSYEFQGTPEDFFGNKKFFIKDYEVYEVLL